MYCHESIKKDYSWIKRVCVIDSSYSLLIYFLISTEEEIQSTYYFWGDGIPQTVRDNFKGRSTYFPEKKSHLSMNLYRNIKLHLSQLYNYYISFYIRYPFLKNKNIEYWGHDHLNYSPYVIHKNKLNIIEDGTTNYFGINPTPHSNRIKNYIFLGPLGIREQYRFQQKTVNSEYLTGLDNNSPAMHSDKAVVISIKQKWEESDESKKKKILYYYNLTKEDLNCLHNCDSVLITQTFSEDNIMSEEDKVEMYKRLISGIEIDHLLIKPHPRETTNYKLYFPNANVFIKKIPIQLFELCNITFKKVYTVFSTAVFSFKDAEVVFWGAEVDDRILKRFSSYTSENLNRRYHTN